MSSQIDPWAGFVDPLADLDPDTGCPWCGRADCPGSCESDDDDDDDDDNDPGQ